MTDAIAPDCVERASDAARECGHKRRYPKRTDAKRAMKEAARRNGDKLSMVGVYECPQCGLWHWGHTPYWKRYAA